MPSDEWLSMKVVRITLLALIGGFTWAAWIVTLWQLSRPWQLTVIMLFALTGITFLEGKEEREATEND